jgi:hypothetical protein
VLNVVEEENFGCEAPSLHKISDRRSSDTDESFLSDYLSSHKVALPDLTHDLSNDEGKFKISIQIF